MNDQDRVEERLAGHMALCTLRYETIGKRLDRIDKALLSGIGILIIQLCALAFVLYAN